MSIGSYANNLNTITKVNGTTTSTKQNYVSYCGERKFDTFEKQEKEQLTSEKNKKLLLFSMLAVIALASAAPMVKHAKEMLNRSVSMCSPNVKEALQYKNFSKIKYFKDLNCFQRIKSLYKLKKSNSANEFFATLNGNKPACFLGAGDGVAHLKNNKEFLAKCDIIINNKDCYILNKNKLKEFIKNNKEIYTSRLEMKKDASIDEIYNKLLKSEAFVKGSTSQDLLGITLGFPKYSSMMFNLERIANLSYLNRNNPASYKESLLKVLRGENSPYKNLNLTSLDSPPV